MRHTYYGRVSQCISIRTEGTVHTLVLAWFYCIICDRIIDWAIKGRGLPPKGLRFMIHKYDHDSMPRL